MRLEAFFASHLLPFANEDAEISGAIRAELEACGRPIRAYDLLITGQAMRNKLARITVNLSEFARIKALTRTDWGKPEL
jgi:tRNA(fMet)-specific endonuclease VapC